MEWIVPLITGLLGAGVALAAVHIKARADDSNWVREKQAGVYRDFIRVLLAVRYVIEYDDDLNLRLGNEAQRELAEANEGLSSMTADFELYASEELKSEARALDRAFSDWLFAGLVPMEPDDVDPHVLEKVGDREGWSMPMRQLSPLDDDYPWDQIEEEGRNIISMANRMTTLIREELGLP